MGLEVGATRFGGGFVHFTEDQPAALQVAFADFGQRQAAGGAMQQAGLELLFQLIGAGFALLTLTLVTGALFVDNLFGQHLVHKTVLSIIAWLIFGALLYGRWKHGWRGRRAVNLTLSGMALLVLAFFGTKAVLELVLHRGL